MIRYLTGSATRSARAVAHAAGIGLMAVPSTRHYLQIPLWPYWAADNGCYAQGDAFDTARWLRWLERRPERSRCLFAVAPDVPYDAEATLRRSLPLLPEVRARGYRVAYAAQNGATVASLPWEQFNVLFLGGDDAFKLGPPVQPLIAEAKRRGMWVHQGRVNSYRRLRLAAVQGCDSADGTYLAFGPEINLPKLLGWLEALRSQPPLPLWEAS